MILVHVFRLSKSVKEVTEYLVALARQRQSSYYRSISDIRSDPLVFPAAQTEYMAGGIVEVRFFAEDGTISEVQDASGSYVVHWPISGCVISATLHPLLDGTHIEFACMSDDYIREFKRMLGILGQHLPEDKPDAPQPAPVAKPDAQNSPPIPGADGSWDDIFVWYYHNRDICRTLRDLADHIHSAYGTVRNKHQEYMAEHGNIKKKSLKK